MQMCLSGREMRSWQTRAMLLWWRYKDLVTSLHGAGRLVQRSDQFNETWILLHANRYADNVGESWYFLKYDYDYFSEQQWQTKCVIFTWCTGTTHDRMTWQGTVLRNPASLLMRVGSSSPWTRINPSQAVDKWWKWNGIFWKVGQITVCHKVTFLARNDVGSLDSDILYYQINFGF